MTINQKSNTTYGKDEHNRFRQQISLSLSPEIVSLLEDIRDKTGINRSRIAERLLWYAVQQGAFDELGVYTYGNTI